MLLRLALGSSAIALLVLVPAGPAAAVAGCEDLLLIPQGGGAVRATVPASLGRVALPADAFAAVRDDDSAPVQARRLAPSEVAVAVLLVSSPGTTKEELAAGQGAVLELLVGLPPGVRTSLVVGGDPTSQLSPLSADRAAALRLLSRPDLVGATDRAAGSLAVQQLPAQSANHLVVVTDGRSPVATPSRPGTQVHRLDYGSAPAPPAQAGCPSGEAVALLPATDAVVRRVQGTYELRVPDGYTEILLSAGRVGVSAELPPPPAPSLAPVPQAGPGAPPSTEAGRVLQPALAASALALLVVAAVLLVRRRRRRDADVDVPQVAALLAAYGVVPPVTPSEPPPATPPAPAGASGTESPVPTTPSTPPTPTTSRSAPTSQAVPAAPQVPAASSSRVTVPVTAPVRVSPREGERPSPAAARPAPVEPRPVPEAPARASAPRPVPVAPPPPSLDDPADSPNPVLLRLADQIEAGRLPADALRASAAVAPPQIGKRLLRAASAVDGGAQLAEALDATAPRRAGAGRIRSELATAAWALRLARSTGAHPWLLLRAGAEGSGAREDARRSAAGAEVEMWVVRGCALLLAPGAVGLRFLGDQPYRTAWLVAAVALATVGAVWVWASTTPPYSPLPLRWRPRAPREPLPGEVLEDAALLAVLLDDVQQAVSAVVAPLSAEQRQAVAEEAGRRVDAGASASHALHQLADEAWERVAAERPRLVTAPVPAFVLCLAPAAVLAVLA